MADLYPLRLLKPYRSMPAGQLLHATAALATRLISLGVACDDVQPGGAARPQAAERAVAPGPREVR
jgi:hypothetical protein